MLVLRCVIAWAVLAVCLVSPSLARYCNNPYCRMCNRLFGPMQSTPVEFKTATKIDCTPIDVVEIALALAQLKPHDLLYDPGCGDGRVLEVACRDHACRAVGIELLPGVAASANARLRAIDRLPTRWRITTGDATQYDLSRATVAFMYLLPETLKQVVPRLTGCTRMLSYSHPIPGFDNRKYATTKGPLYFVGPVELASRRAKIVPPKKVITTSVPVARVQAVCHT